MAKSPFARKHALGFALSARVGLALIRRGSQTGAGSGATGQAIEAAPFCVAPVEGSPEQTVADGGP